MSDWIHMSQCVELPCEGLVDLKMIDGDICTRIDAKNITDKGWLSVDYYRWVNEEEFKPHSVDYTAPYGREAVKDALGVLDRQVGGDHYRKLGEYQPWQVFAKWMSPEELKGFMKGTVITYLQRESDKGQREGIEKAKHTLELYLEVTKDEN